MFTNFGRDIVFSADLCYNEANEKPSSDEDLPQAASSLQANIEVARGRGSPKQMK